MIINFLIDFSRLTATLGNSFWYYFWNEILHEKNLFNCFLVYVSWFFVVCYRFILLLLLFIATDWYVCQIPIWISQNRNRKRIWRYKKLNNKKKPVVSNLNTNHITIQCLWPLYFHDVKNTNKTGGLQVFG